MRENARARRRRLVLALPNGRILGELMPLLARAGIVPEPAFDDRAAAPAALRHQRPGARPDPRAQLRRRDLRRLRRGPARRRRQRRADGVRLSRDLRAARPRYRALPPGGRGAGRAGPRTRTRSAGAMFASPPNIREITRRHFARARRAGGMHQAERRDRAGADARPVPAHRRPGVRPAPRSRPTAWSRSSTSPT